MCSAVCSKNEAKFGDSATCAAATPTADMCPTDEAEFGAGCVVKCPAGQVVSASGDTCVAQKCCSSDTQCAVGNTCPGGTLVSAECADRSAFDESPCACTALQQLAALSPSLPGSAPWSDPEGAAYCKTGSHRADCATVDGVKLPVAVIGRGADVAGALPPSLGEFGSSLTYLALSFNAITSLPTEVGALTGLEVLGLSDNQLTGVPTEFRTVNPTDGCVLFNNDQSFSCANVGAGTSCCTADNCGDRRRARRRCRPRRRRPCRRRPPGPALTPSPHARQMLPPACRICPGGTPVSAACADRSAFGENPCVCTALEELAALSPSLPTEVPWNDLANAAYCTGDVQYGSLGVSCAPVDGVQLPTEVIGSGTGLAGALPPSLGELGPSLARLDLPLNAITSVPTELGALTALTELALGDNAITSLPTELGALAGLKELDLDENAITSVPTEIGALTGLTDLRLANNQMTGVPAEFRTVDPAAVCSLFNNPDFSCANVSAGSATCCTANNCPGGTSTCYSG